VFAAGLEPDTDPAVLQVAFGNQPQRRWSRPWNPRRVLAQRLDGALLPHDDGTLAGVLVGADVSVDSTFLDDVLRALAPGGLLSLAATIEGGHEEFIDATIGDRGWGLLSPFVDYRSMATLETGAPALVHPPCSSP
jgi:hypothetical protein